MDVRRRWRIGCLAATLIIALAAGANAQGPVAYYRFNGSTEDSSGHGNHCVNQGAVATADRFGTPNSAYLVGDFGNLEAPEDASLDISDAFSVCAWIRQDEMVSYIATIVGKGMNTGYSVGVFSGGSYDCPDPTANRYVLVSVAGASNGFVLAPHVDCGTGEWHHIVVTVSTEPGDQHTATLYLDGAPAGTAPLGGTFTNNDAPLGIGNDGELNYPFAGAIDDVRLYDRVLSADEAADIYNSIWIDGFESGSSSAWSSSVPTSSAR